ncbi:hypothetical protein PYCC9005_005481 [Savitreella phatthalungensis]
MLLLSTSTVRTLGAPSLRSSRAAYRLRRSSTEPQRQAPFPFLWPSLDPPPRTTPYAFKPVIGMNPDKLGDRLFAFAMGFLCRYKGLNRALNAGWTSMLLTRETFPRQFVAGAVVAFEEFLRRCSCTTPDDRDISALCDPGLTSLLQPYLAGDRPEEPSIKLISKGGQVGIKDVWLLLGEESAFDGDARHFDRGLLQTREAMDPRSSTGILQLPFTSAVQRDRDLPVLALESAGGLRIHIDVAFEGKFEYGYEGEVLEQQRSAVVRFSSQHFGPARGPLETAEQRTRRILELRDTIQWRISDVDYVVSGASTEDQS